MKKYLLLFILLIPFCVNALEYPKTNSKIVEVYDLDDSKVLYEQNSKNVASIASLTKIVTTIVAIENIKDLDEQVVITKEILNTVDPVASTAKLKVGDKLTYRDLLYASILPSGADATNALGILSSGSIDNFVKKMNELVKKLKLKNTHFVNTTGLDDKAHYSTADDITKVLAYALKNSKFKKVFTTYEYKMTNGNVVKASVKKYKADPKKIKGSKTGFTGDAGYCLATLTKVSGHDIVIVVLKAEKGKHVVDTTNLIDFMNENYKEEILVKKNKLIKTIKVELSKEEEYKVYSDKDVKKYLPSDYDKNKIKIKYEGLRKLSYKNKKGSHIGTIKYYYDNEILYKQDVKLYKNLKVSLKKWFKKNYYLVIIPVVIILLIFGLKKHKK